MAEKDNIFLTMEQALEAVCLDFRQYEAQVLLFSEILGLLSKTGIIAKRETGQNAIWIRTRGARKMRLYEGIDLIDTMCDLLHKSKPDPLLMSSICGRVFQTRAFPDEDPVSGLPGIRILTGMEGFACRQCGRCCRTLDYHNEITAGDVATWQRAGRHDILDWVGVFKNNDREDVYRIWIKPGTREFAGTCPFLEKVPHENRRVCRIHDVKPRICRQYPVSRKHALMTGCPGFMPV
jgi:Fe-S-cluster containining protein